MSTLEIRSIHKQYSSRDPKVLNDLSLSINQGEIIALLGESGCGKTTLLRIMAGFIEADQGSMEFDNRSIFTASKGLLPEKRNIGFVFQDFALFPHLTVEKNIAFGLKGLSRRDQKARVQQLLVRTGLQGLGKRYPYQLSGGQQQRVAIARALAPQPGLILLDEPFNSLDAGIKAQMLQFVRDLLKESKTTAVFVSHDFKEALALADKGAILSQGQIVQFGDIMELKNSPNSPLVKSLVHTA